MTRKKKPWTNQATVSKDDLIRQEIFARPEWSLREIASELSVSEQRANKQASVLFEAGVLLPMKTEGQNGWYQTNPRLTTKQAVLVSCVSERRIRALITEKRIEAEKAGRDYLINAESLRTFVRTPRATGTRGQSLLHGDSWTEKRKKWAKSKAKKKK